MNINFIGKEFDRLGHLEDFINYEYEPKSNKRLGKRNIYFDDIKLDFINEVNTYGFSPFILKNFSDQRDDPNIMRYMTKKFNHGLTNYIKLKTKAIAHHTSKEIKKYISKKKKKGAKSQKKEKKIYTNIYLIKKNEEKKIDEIKENFLQKALINMGGYKLNISMDDDEENKDKLKDKEKDNEDDNDENSIKGKDKIINKNDISSHYETKNISEKTKTELWLKKNNPQLPIISQNTLNTNNDINFLGNFTINKRVSFLNKNKNAEKSNILSTINSFEFKLNNNERKKTYNNKFRKKKKSKKDEFLLFTKARPYRYMMTSEGK